MADDPTTDLSHVEILANNGVNSAIDPELIREGQLAWGRNVALRGGKPHNRPGIRKLVQLPDGIIQAGGIFSIQNGMIIMVINGNIYRGTVAVTNFTFEQIPIGQNNPGLHRAYLVQAEEHFIIGDNESRPIIFDGATAVRATAMQVPKGTWMAFGNGRLWIAVERNKVKAGDITGTSPGSYLNFTEVEYLLGGGAFHFSDEITGLAFLPLNDTTTGFGSLLVTGFNFIEAIRAEVIVRALWASTPSMQTSVFGNIGCESGESMVAVNQDIFFRSEDGMRSFRSTIPDLNTAGQTSISEEVSRVLDFDTKRWLKWSSAVYFNNRLHFTHSPLISSEDGSVFHQGLGSLDFANIQQMGQKSAPAYDGSWDGPLPVKLFKGRIRGEERCFIAARELDGSNFLYEISKDDDWDTDWSYDVPSPRRPTCYVEYRKMDFTDPRVPKTLVGCDIWVSSLLDKVDIQVYWRPDRYPEWIKWNMEQEVYIRPVATYEATIDRYETVYPEYRVRIRSQTAPELPEGDNTGYLDVGYHFQIKIEWRGKLKIEEMWLTATPVDSYAPGDAKGDIPTDSPDPDLIPIPAAPSTWPLYSGDS